MKGVRMIEIVRYATMMEAVNIQRRFDEGISQKDMETWIEV